LGALCQQFQAVRKAKKQHPDILLFYLRPYHPMVDNSQFLIAYARYTACNAWELVEYAMKRGKT
jgi:hypothetical protein